MGPNDSYGCSIITSYEETLGLVGLHGKVPVLGDKRYNRTIDDTGHLLIPS